MKKEIDELNHLEHSKTCFFGNFPPKECGIATFTKNLSSAMDRNFNPMLKSKVIAINEPLNPLDYPEKVISSINKEDICDYIEIAKKMNESDNIKLVCVQHEFGIFGGNYGSYIIPFLETLKKPVVITFHSVLPNPDPLRKTLVQAIAKRTSAIIVMANIAVEILNKDYGIEKEKMFVVHHGIPNVPFYADNLEFKKKLGLEGKIVLATFGLLSRGKGNEFVIKALPQLVKKYPNLLYRIIGKTHPIVKKQEGEKYRNSLMRLVRKLGLKNNVEFVNKYPTYEELIENILATDIYLATNLEKNQITSGTLIEAMGYGGKAIVSTKSIYAEEVLADGRGITVDFKNPEEYMQAIDKVLSNPQIKTEMERLAYAFSRQAIWSNVAYQYLKIFNKIVELRKEVKEKFPPVKLSHISNLTDEYGMIQFANHSSPEKSSGYTLDDNARALITTVLHNKLFNSQQSMDLANVYINFMEKSQDPNGNFRNNHFNEEEKTNPYSEDSFGRAIWSLGFAIENSTSPLIKEKAKNMLSKSINYFKNLESPRAKAFILTGLYHYYKSEPTAEVLSIIQNIADRLVWLYEKESTEKWHWFEPYMTYSNSTLTEAMFLAYDLTKNQKYLDVAENTLKFLTDITIIDGKLHPIGQNGWYNRHKERAFFDQQPLDASSIVQTYLVANRVTKKQEHYDNAVLAFNWFLGLNHLNQMIYDETTGGCFDGLGRHSLNFNQGAESTVSYHLARLFMEEHKRLKKTGFLGSGK